VGICIWARYIETPLAGLLCRDKPRILMLVECFDIPLRSLHEPNPPSSLGIRLYQFGTIDSISPASSNLTLYSGPMSQFTILSVYPGIRNTYVSSFWTLNYVFSILLSSEINCLFL